MTATEYYLRDDVVRYSAALRAAERRGDEAATERLKSILAERHAALKPYDLAR